MLTEFLDEHPLINLMKGTVGCPYPSADDRARWDHIPQTIRDSLLSSAETYRSIPYPMLTATQFMAFVRDGSRTVYEEPYFLRRKKLITAAISVCISGTNDDLDSVIDGIWCICEETSWVISAHNGSAHEGMRPAAERPLPDPQNPYVDLFAAQTAMILSLISVMLRTQLNHVSPLICRRISQEIERRVLLPFETRDDYWWMGFIRKDLCNWTPWIVSNVMMTATQIISDKPRLASLLDRACRMLDRWINILPDDGGCDEGVAYWNMAGGALLDCLQLLSDITDGKMCFWDDLKLRGILSFPAAVQLPNGWYVNFADCDARPYLSGERLQYAGECLHDNRLIAMGTRLRAHPTDQLSDTPQLWRLLNELFHPVGKTDENCSALERNVWLPDLQLRVVESNGVILAAKGGHNGESHNHNDVGSYMLYVDGEPVIVDAGNMVYTSKTFSDQRYTLWNTRSMYHNVPLIGETEQAAGGMYRAENVVFLPDGLSLDMSQAYPSGVLSCQRNMTLDDQGAMYLDDMIRTEAAAPVTWTFMLRHVPVISASEIETGPITIAVPDGMTVQTEEITITDPRMAKNYPGSLWRLTCTDAPGTDHHVSFVCRRNHHA